MAMAMAMAMATAMTRKSLRATLPTTHYPIPMFGSRARFLFFQTREFHALQRRSAMTKA